MSFATALALLVGLLISVPVAAHLLRRGKTTEQEFPPARLVPAVTVTSDKRSRLEDWLLLALRSLMILALAVLGATPFVRCSDLSVERTQGASIAMAIVVDDSQSMRSQVAEARTRFELALQGAEQLLSSAREGDVVALIAAGNPARVVLNASPDLAAARRALSTLRQSDRATDLQTALQLARSALKELPHADKRVILLSDLATRSLPEGDPAPWLPLPVLRSAVDNCGIAVAEQEAQDVFATVGCTSANAAQGRNLEIVLASDPSGAALASTPLQAFSGVQKVHVRVDGLGLELATRLTEDDAIEADNRALVALEAGSVVIAVAADPTKAGAITGGPTVIEQALSALDPSFDVRPLSQLPEAAEDLKRYSALIVDDPAGLSPEERLALGDWLKSGGVALGLLGPSSSNAQLAASSEPFARSGAPWDPSEHAGVDPASVAWLGKEAQSLASLTRGGRIRLDAADLPGAKVMGSWQDGVPFLFRREVERGLVFTAGLPASVEESDFALRPGFLALLQLVVSEAQQRTGPKRSTAGTPWLFQGEHAVTAVGPGGVLQSELVSITAAAQQQLVPDLAGRYEVQLQSGKELRLVTLDSDELTLPATPGETLAAANTQTQSNSQINASPHWALALLGLFALEMLLRRYNDAVGRSLQKLRVRLAPTRQLR